MSPLDRLGFPRPRPSGSVHLLPIYLHLKLEVSVPRYLRSSFPIVMQKKENLLVRRSTMAHGLKHVLPARKARLMTISDAFFVVENSKNGHQDV